MKHIKYIRFMIVVIVLCCCSVDVFSMDGNFIKNKMRFPTKIEKEKNISSLLEFVLRKESEKSKSSKHKRTLSLRDFCIMKKMECCSLEDRKATPRRKK